MKESGHASNNSILIISHVNPYPPAAGNEIRILKMMQWLKSEGFSTVLLLNAHHISPESRRGLDGIVDHIHLINDDYGATFNPLQKVLNQEKDKRSRFWSFLSSCFRARLHAEEHKKKATSEAVKKSLAPDRLIQITEHLCGMYRPCAVIAEYIFTAPCLDVVPAGILKIIDTHDMFSRKNEQVLSFGIDDPLPCTRQEEREYLQKSDVIIAIQSNEAKLFADLVLECDVITVGIDFKVVDEIDNRSVIPGSILVVGSDNPLNQHGLLEFYRHAWPIIRGKDQGSVLRIVGKLANHLKVDDKRVQCAGWVADLDAEYRKAAVVINPTLAGTGLKIKSVEALCQAKPLVGTPNSVEGIDYTNVPPFIIGKDWNEFAEAVTALLSSEIMRSELQQTALRFAKESFSSKKVYAPLGQKLSAFCINQHTLGAT